MNIKIQGGTAQADEDPLCLSCKHAAKVGGLSYKETRIVCYQGMFGATNSRYGGVVPYPVYSCSAYMNHNHPYIHEMEEIAWILKTDVRTNQIGFKPISKLSDEERRKLRIGSDVPVPRGKDD